MNLIHNNDNEEVFYDALSDSVVVKVAQPINEEDEERGDRDTSEVVADYGRMMTMEQETEAVSTLLVEIYSLSQ